MTEAEWTALRKQIRQYCVGCSIGFHLSHASRTLSVDAGCEWYVCVPGCLHCRISVDGRWTGDEREEGHDARWKKAVCERTLRQRYGNSAKPAKSAVQGRVGEMLREGAGR